MTSGVEQIYRYARPSSVQVLDGHASLHLSTSGGMTSSGASARPQFFDGFLGHAEQSASALLTVARVARTRFYVPPGMLASILRAADPVVTSNADRLRFESFSACCGVYARLDLLPAALDGAVFETGTTNVDFNPPMRAALAGVAGLDPLHLSVGENLTITTLDTVTTEEKVQLPLRWVKGFAEVQLAAVGVRPAFEVTIAEARRFIRSLPPAGGPSTLLWAVPAGKGLRLTSRPETGAVTVAGPDRLRVLEPMLRFAQTLRAYAAPDAGSGRPSASVWELELADARLVLTLSPEVSRGFSGEGGVLRDLAAPESAADADLISALLAFEPRIDIPDLSRRSALSGDAVRRALNRLGAAGRVGFDAHEGAYFHRELPFDSRPVESMHPRLRDAQTLMESGAVRTEGDVIKVTSSDVEHVVRRGDRGWHCSCPWYAKHQDSRGPCKHVLAVELLQAVQQDQQRPE